jgi:adenylate cyclase
MSSLAKLRSKFRLTIGTKLVGLIAFLLLISVVGLVTVSTWMFTDDNRSMINQVTLETAGSLATRMRDTFEGVTSRMRMIGTILIQETIPAPARDQVLSEFFEKDKDYLALVIHKNADTDAPVIQNRAISPELVAAGDPDGEKTLSALTGEKDFSLARISRGEAILASIRLQDGTPAMVVGVPFIASSATPDRFTHTLTAIIRQSKFSKAIGESETVTSYMVDHKGRLIAHPDATRVAAGENVSKVEIVSLMLEGKTPNGQKPFIDPITHEARLGAFYMVGFGGLGIVSEVPEAKVYESADSVKRKSIYFAIVIICIAFLTGYLYSGTITWPIKQLVVAAHRITAGDFAINLKTKGHDEVATLSAAFNDMAKGLEERDRVKATFNKFHNKEIAEKLLSGEVKLGGERKEATIFFSDVRGFTAMSETMEPEQVVEMLNEYMTRMVSIIRAHNGIVDKYVGDAIMAIWGVPLTGEDDAGNAVKACIAMREELARLNELRLSRGQGALRIGMGLNTGQVIAGNIGSDEKMEYTVIGDSVNLASRMESMTKEYGTDFLVPKVIQDRLKDRFVFEQCKSAKVKGKAQAIEIFKVRGYINESGQAVMVDTAYSSYESEKSDKVVHEAPATVAAAAVAEVVSIVAGLPPMFLAQNTPSSGFVGETTDTSIMDMRSESSYSLTELTIPIGEAESAVIMDIAVAESVLPPPLPSGTPPLSGPPIFTPPPLPRQTELLAEAMTPPSFVAKPPIAVVPPPVDEPPFVIQCLEIVEVKKNRAA